MPNSRRDIGSPTGAPERTIAKVLVGQKALVTGANSGIGEAAAIALGQAGADVVVNYVTGEDRARAVVDAIRRSGAKADAHKADVSQEDQVEDMFHHMVERFGTVDILVNNAGHEMTLAQWNTVIGINLTGQFLCARAAVRESGGAFEAVTDEELLNARALLARDEGVFVEPSSAAPVAGLLRRAREGRLDGGLVIVCVLTGHGLKDPEAVLRSERRPEPVAATLESLERLVGEVLVAR